MPLQGYKVLAKDGLRGPFLKKSIIKGIAAGTVPLDARLLDIETGLYVPAWSLIATSLEEARRIGGPAASDAVEKALPPSSEAKPVETRTGGGAEVAPSVPPAPRNEEASQKIAPRFMLAIAAVCLCILLAGMIVGAAVLLSGGSQDGSGDKQKTAAQPEAVPKSAKRQPEQDTDREEAARLAKELDQQRAEIEALKQQLAAKAVLEQADSGPDTGKPSNTPAEEIAPSFAELVERYNPSVFLIYVELTVWDEKGERQVVVGTGTGWLAERNLIVTNKHVLFPFLFNATQCSAFEWLTREGGWKFNPSEMLVAAFPTGAVLRKLDDGSSDVFRDAWVYDGLNIGLKSKGTLSLAALLPDVMTEAIARSAAGDTQVQVHEKGCNDLALLRIEGGGADALAPLPLASSSDLRSLRQMEELMTVGFPHGLTFGLGQRLQTSPAQGHLRYHEAEKNTFVTSASVHPGNSGGPIVRSDGKVVGVATWQLHQSPDLGGAIDVNRVRTLLSPGGSDMGGEYLKSLAPRFQQPVSNSRTGTSTSRVGSTPADSKPSTARGEESGPSDWNNAQESAILTGWLGLREGQTQAEVEKLIGRAPETGADSISTIWRYPDKNGAKVYFSPSTKLVRRWVTPWSRLQQWDGKNRVKQLLGEPGATWNYDIPGEPRYEYWVYRAGTELYWVAFDHQGELAGWKMPKD